MVCLSVAILTNPGKVLLARQFVAMSRIRIEGLLAAFPKLVGTNKQHTFVETDNVRYVYQRLDDLYILLITTKQSNIMEDLETLKTISKLVPEYCDGQTEAAVTSHCFQLIAALDETISLGYKESATLQQIRTFTEMDSHEEKLQKIIMESKMNEAREESRRKAEALDRKKREMRKMERSLGGGGGFGSGGGGGGGYPGSRSGGGGGGGGRHDMEDKMRKQQEQQAEKQRAAARAKAATRSSGIKGMSLGKSKTKEDFFSKLSKEETFMSIKPQAMPVAGGAGSAGAVPVEELSHDKVNVIVEEKLTVVLEREGGIKKFDLKGEMKVAVFDPDTARLKICTSSNLSDKAFKCMLHPKVDKKKYKEEGSLQLAKSDKPFPLGAENAAVILKWRYQKGDESEVPFTLNFWPNSEDGQSVVSVEFARAKEFTYNNVQIEIPCPSAEPPSVSSCDGDHHFDSRANVLIWTVDSINDETDTGSFEFSVPEMDENDFFPITCRFDSPDTYAGLTVDSVQHVDSGEEAEHVATISMRSDKFQVSAE